jgi:hypothetical protein
MITAPSRVLPDLWLETVSQGPGIAGDRAVPTRRYWHGHRDRSLSQLCLAALRAAKRGAGEGSRPFDLQPQGTRITGATTADANRVSTSPVNGQ